MKDTLITKKTSLLAKEKQFDVTVVGIWCTNCNTGRINFFPFDKASNRQLKNYKGSCTRPTQSLLKKWLREVHDIHVTVHYYKNGSYSCHISDDCDNCMTAALFGESFKTYEEALEKGLQGALKLI